VEQGILPFVFEAAPQPMDLTAFAGLTLVSETMLALGLDEVVRERLQLRERQRGYDEFDKLHALVLVQAAGATASKMFGSWPGTRARFACWRGRCRRPMRCMISWGPFEERKSRQPRWCVGIGEKLGPSNSSTT
jgi:hypothetical protein